MTSSHNILDDLDETYRYYIFRTGPDGVQETVSYKTLTDPFIDKINAAQVEKEKYKEELLELREEVDTLKAVIKIMVKADKKIEEERVKIEDLDERIQKKVEEIMEGPKKLLLEAVERLKNITNIEKTETGGRNEAEESIVRDGEESEGETYEKTTDEKVDKKKPAFYISSGDEESDDEDDLTAVASSEDLEPHNCLCVEDDPDDFLFKADERVLLNQPNQIQISRDLPYHPFGEGSDSDSDHENIDASNVYVADVMNENEAETEKLAEEMAELVLASSAPTLGGITPGRDMNHQQVSKSAHPQVAESSPVYNPSTPALLVAPTLSLFPMNNHWAPTPAIPIFQSIYQSYYPIYPNYLPNWGNDTLTDAFDAENNNSSTLQFEDGDPKD